MIKRAFITGITGQDGFYLSELLLDKGYIVYGLARRNIGSSPPLRKDVQLFYGDLLDKESVRRALEESRPDEVYNLAAQSDVSFSFKHPDETTAVNYYGVGNLINEIIKINPSARVYQASTSEMFGKTPPPQNESSPFSPVSPYGVSKLKAYEDFVVGGRKKRGLFICSGITFSHESPYRGENFVTRKITLSLCKIKTGSQDFFELGNLETKRDWGFAGDYIRAMHLMLQQDQPDDFVIATGETHSVRDFVESTAQTFDMKIFWEGSRLEEVAKDESGKIILKINKDFYRPAEVNCPRGDSSKARRVLGWRPVVNFKELVKMMADSDLISHSRK